MGSLNQMHNFIGYALATISGLNNVDTKEKKKKKIQMEE